MSLPPPFRVRAAAAGVLGLYRGLPALLWFSVPKVSSRFFAFETLKNALQEPDGTMSAGKTLLCGLGAGTAEAVIAVTPMDTIKTCMQGDLGRVKYDGIVQTGQLLAKEYGVVQGLFKGLFLRVSLISTTFFLVNTFKQWMVPVLFPHTVTPAKKAL